MSPSWSSNAFVHFEARGTMKFVSPFHSRGTAKIVGLDAPLVRDGVGRLIVPGTSLAGALRAWATENIHDSGDADKGFGQGDIDALFGPRAAKRESALSQTAASCLTCCDVVIDNATESLRDGVGIDRYSGAAAENFKFDYSLLEPGAEGTVQLRLRLPANDAEGQSGVYRAFLACLAALRDGEFAIGGLVTKGLGRFTVENLKALRWHSGRDAILDRVANAGGPSWSQTASTTPIQLAENTHIGPTADFNVEFRQLGPMFSRFRVDGGLVDAVPLVERRDGKAVLVIPGSSVKGVLRSEAERIMRTLLNLDLPSDGSLNDQVKVPLVNKIFGTGKISSQAKAAPTALTDELCDQRGAMECPDLVSKHLCTWEQWQDLQETIASEKRTEKDKAEHAGQLRKLRQKLDTASLKAWKVTTNVAIDRWTGGAAEGKLFSVLEPHNVEWQLLRLRLHVHRLSDDETAAAKVLLHLVLAALHEQRLGFGFGFDRGYGRVSAETINGSPYTEHRNDIYETHREAWRRQLERYRSAKASS